MYTVWKLISSSRLNTNTTASTQAANWGDKQSQHSLALMNSDARQASQPAYHLEFRGASFISDQQQVTLAIHHNLLLKPSP